MLSWFRRRRPAPDAPRLRPRRSRGGGREALGGLGPVAPELLPFLGQVACLTLADFGTLSAAATAAPGLAARETIAHAAGAALLRHQGLVAELRRHGAEPDEAMRPFLAPADRLHALMRDARWQETLLGAHLCGGLLDGFFAALAAGVGSDAAAGALLAAEPAADSALVVLLADAVEEDAVLSARLALWGRRIIGDALLLARSALRPSGDAEADEQRIGPLFAELLAEHTRRMDALGLAA